MTITMIVAVGAKGQLGLNNTLPTQAECPTSIDLVSLIQRCVSSNQRNYKTSDDPLMYITYYRRA